MEAARKIAAASRTSYFVRRTVTSSGTRKILLRVSPLGRFMHVILV
jgi:hypothetical protein